MIPSDQSSDSDSESSREEPEKPRPVAEKDHGDQ